MLIPTPSPPPSPAAPLSYLTTPVKNDQAVTVAYNDPSGGNDNNAVQDSAGNDAITLASTAVTNNSTVAGTPPASSAATTTDGTKVVLTYNEALSSNTAAASAFTVTTGGNANAVTAVAVSGSTVELTLTNSIKKGQKVTASYRDPKPTDDDKALQDKAGNDAASLKQASVTNNSNVDGTGPMFLSATTPRRHQGRSQLRREPVLNYPGHSIHSHH